MFQTQPSRIGVRYPHLPTMYDLPSEDPEEPGLPDRFHELQPDLLSQTCQSPIYPQENYLAAQDLNLYYDLEHPRWYKRPDWFVVLGVESERRQEELRLSYVTWQEEVNPFLVVELLSPGTEAEDLGKTVRDANAPPTKWQVYEQILQIPYYAIYDRYKNTFQAFRLAGNRYRPLEVSTGRLCLDELGLGLGVWQGHYQGVMGLWLRFYDREHNWIATPSEQAQRAQQQADRERVRASREQVRADREQVRADREQQEKELATERADRAELTLRQERERAERAELELQQLKERLQQLEGDRSES